MTQDEEKVKQFVLSIYPDAKIRISDEKWFSIIADTGILPGIRVPVSCWCLNEFFAWREVAVQINLKILERFES